MIRTETPTDSEGKGLRRGIPSPRLAHAVLGLFLALPCAEAHDHAPTSLLVGVKAAEPFVIVESGPEQELSGFSIDLIKAIAAEMDPPRTVEFRIYPDLAEHLEAVRTGEVDFGISATSLTSDRERTLDFSIPFYQAGLAVAVRPDRGVRILDTLMSPKVLRTLLWLAVYMVVCAHLIWLVERGKGGQFDRRWPAGVLESMWWTIVTMTTVGYGDFVPKRPVSRALGVLVIISGIVLFGIALGAFSSALTLRQLRSNIQGPEDLDGKLIGKPVAVVRSTLSDEAMGRRGVELLQVESLPQALEAVESGKAVAAVHDVALMRYHLPKTAPGLIMVGGTFMEHGYGITFPTGSPHREEVNIALLGLMEGDRPVYQHLKNRWFGL